MQTLLRMRSTTWPSVNVATDSNSIPMQFNSAVGFGFIRLLSANFGRSLPHPSTCRLLVRVPQAVRSVFIANKQGYLFARYVFSHSFVTDHFNGPCRAIGPLCVYS